MSLRQTAILSLASLALSPVLATQTASLNTGGVGNFGSIPTLRDYALQEMTVVDEGDLVTLDVQFEGKTYLVDLEPHSLRADDFRVMVQDDGGQFTEWSAPELTTYRGIVRDAGGRILDDSAVSAARVPEGWQLTLIMPEVTQDYVIVQPVNELLPGAKAAGVYAVYTSADVTEHGGRCNEDFLDIEEEQFVPDPGTPETAKATGNNRVKIAFDTDVEYYNLNGMNVSATLADVENVLNNVSIVYERDVGVAYELTVVVVRALSSTTLDPYNKSNSSDLLSQFTVEWNNNLGAVQRGVAHLMTGRDLDGAIIGVATRSTVCKVKSAYALSQTLFTNNVPNRTTLTAHELGHNFSSFHCDQNLQVECCVDCHIMCSSLGACNGVGLPEFGAVAQGFINRHVATFGCDKPLPAPLTPPFFDSFPSATISKTLWSYNDKATGVTGASNEPSLPRSMKLNAQGMGPGRQDDVRSERIDLDGLAGASLDFFEEHRRVEAGEELVIEYNPAGGFGWIELMRLTSDGTNEVDFEFHSIPLPAGALHSESRVRFRFTGNEVNDAWFIDDVTIGVAAALTQGPLRSGEISELTVHNRVDDGDLVVFLVSLAGTGRGTSFFGGALTLDLLPPVQVLDVVSAGKSGQVSYPIAIPLGTGPLELHSQAVILKQPLTQSVKSNVVTRQLEF